MHVIILFRNFLHWYVISLKLIIMHKLGIISCLINYEPFVKFKLIEVNLFSLMIFDFSACFEG